MTLAGRDHLKVIIESILFVADDPVEISSLARVTGRRESDVEDAVEAIASEGRERGLRVQRTGEAVQMVTAPEAAPFVEQFLGVDEDQRISHAALETLAIIAYKQPIGRQVIEAIRGVNCDRALASLKARGLVTEVGRAPTAGRPYLYGTTFRFLEHFGLEKPEDLPPLPDMPLEIAGSDEDEGARSQEAEER
ncbi:MAG TPA: SMC-Scp complex subunit ScpB [Dehalococcoidia bacterium]|nr:SMC-Scp complex subunit ScpB [Dehalococcoidia bacterium]